MSATWRRLVEEGGTELENYEREAVQAANNGWYGWWEWLPTFSDFRYLLARISGRSGLSLIEVRETALRHLQGIFRQAVKASRPSRRTRHKATV